ncbi:MAG: hypothetical protein JXN65_06370 [Clostridia bacterium]|nr:hypothetical protein [Clostridia bacterium]
MNNAFKKWSKEKTLFVLHGIGFVMVCFYGSVVHDLARTFPNFLGRMLFPSNLCLWEQGKILLVGMSIWFLIEYLIVGRKIRGFIFIHTIIASSLPILMLIVYLTHTNLFGDFSLEGAHIVLSVALILLGFIVSVVMITSKKDYSSLAPYGIAIYVIIVMMYAVFTYLPPNVGMFYDDMHKAFGPVWK